MNGQGLNSKNLKKKKTPYHKKKGNRSTLLNLVLPANLSYLPAFLTTCLGTAAAKAAAAAADREI
jgi:hypothetical protein